MNPASPELNLIEILWKKIKYEWLNLLSIKNLTEFEKEVERVFASFGKKYMISFANYPLLRRGSQLLKVVLFSRKRNKQYYCELSAVDRGEKISDFYPFGTGN